MNNGGVSKANAFLVYLLIAAIFLDGFAIRNLAGFDFYFYYFIFVIGIIASIFKYSSFSIGPRWFVSFLMLFFAVNIATGVVFNTLGFLMLKQIGGIIFTAAAYWAIFLFANGNLRFIGKAYINVSYFAAIYGLLGLLVSISGLGRFGVYGMQGNLLGLPKISGSTSEPYFLAVSLIPAVYIHLNDIFTPSKLLGKDFSWPKSVLTIICFILTGASSGYIAFFIILALLAYNKNLLNMRSLGLVLLPLFMYVVYFIYTVFSTNSKDFSSRVSDTWYVFSSDDEEGVKAGKINGSSFALYSNFKVASNSFIKNPLSGSGLGTHEVNYQQYFYKYFSSKIVKRFVAELNKEDANSTFIRLLSETGLFGLFFFLFFVFRNLSLRKHESHFDSSVRFLLLFNQGIFIMLIIRLMRTGNYIGNGFFFFFFFYWASSLFLGEVLGPRKSAGLGMLSGKNSQPSPNI